MTHIPPKHYIDRDSVAKALSTVFSDKEHGDPNFVNGIITAVDFILDYPTEKVEEVRHGYWKMCYYPNDEHVECSECHAQYYEDDLYLGGNEFPKWCPECGAHMNKAKTATSETKITCKDCKHCYKQEGVDWDMNSCWKCYCWRTGRAMPTNPYFYCPYAEKKEKEE